MLDVSSCIAISLKDLATNVPNGRRSLPFFKKRGTPFQKNILICGIYPDMLAAMRNLVGNGFMFRVDIGPSVVLVLFAWRQSH